MALTQEIPTEILDKLTDVGREAVKKIQDIKRRKREQGLLLFENMEQFKVSTLDLSLIHI